MIGFAVLDARQVGDLPRIERPSRSGEKVNALAPFI
jgi:hypothetical protein